MFKKLLLKLIKRGNNIEEVLKDVYIRNSFLMSLSDKEKLEILSCINYDNVIVNKINLENKKISLSGSILVNVRIENCIIEGGLVGNKMYNTNITSNTMTPEKRNVEKIDLINLRGDI